MSNDRITQEFKDAWPVGTKVIIPEGSKAEELLGTPVGTELIVNGWDYTDAERLAFDSIDGSSGNFSWILKPEWVEKVVPTLIPADYNKVKVGDTVTVITQKGKEKWNRISAPIGHTAVVTDKRWSDICNEYHLVVEWAPGVNQMDGGYEAEFFGVPASKSDPQVVVQRIFDEKVGELDDAIEAMRRDAIESIIAELNSTFNIKVNW